MQTKTFVTLFCMNTLFSTTAWSMQPGARLVAITAHRRLALFASRKTCITGMQGIHQLSVAKSARRFSSNSASKPKERSSGKQFAYNIAAGAAGVGAGFIGATTFSLIFKP